MIYSSAKHTPTPWKVFYAKNNGQKILGVGQETGEGITNSQGWLWGEDHEAKANAEFIVRACNSHDALVESLKSMPKLCSYHDEYGDNFDFENYQKDICEWSIKVKDVLAFAKAK